MPKKMTKECPPLVASLCQSLGIPAPVPEYRFCERRWRFDWAWVDELTALEVEGGIWNRGRHSRGKGFEADMAKYNRATILGWKVLRCTPDQFESGEGLLAVKEAILGGQQ